MSSFAWQAIRYVLARRAVRQDGRVEKKDERITSKLLRNQTTLTRWRGLIYDPVENQESGSPLRRAVSHKAKTLADFYASSLQSQTFAV